MERMAKPTAMLIKVTTTINPCGDRELTLPLNFAFIKNIDLRIDLSAIASESSRRPSDRAFERALLSAHKSVLELLVNGVRTLPNMTSVLVSLYVLRARDPGIRTEDEAELLACQERVAFMTKHDCLKGLDIYTGRCADFGDCSEERSFEWAEWGKRAVLWMRYSFETGRMERVDGHAKVITLRVCDGSMPDR